MIQSISSHLQTSKTQLKDDDPLKDTPQKASILDISDTDSLCMSDQSTDTLPDDYHETPNLKLDPTECLTSAKIDLRPTRINIIRKNIVSKNTQNTPKVSKKP